MKRVFLSILALQLFHPSHASADGLIEVPKGAEEEAVKATGGKQLYDHGDIPESGSIDVYTRWAQQLIEAGQKNLISEVAYQTPVKPGVRCLWFQGAFGFRKSGSNQYELNCFAGNARKISHVAFYKMNFSYTPPDCASEAKIRSFFKPDGVRNRNGAMQFIQMLNNTCPLKVTHANPQAPITRAVRMSAEDVQAELEKPDREPLRLFVTQGKKQKQGGGAQESENPLRSGDQSDSAK